MNAVVTLALKDLKILLRSKESLFWLFAFPLMFALFFGFLFGGGGSTRALTIAVIDLDEKPESKKLVERLEKSDALNVITMSREEAEEKVRKGELVAYLVIPSGYSKSAKRFGRPGSGPPLQVGIDPSRKAEKGMLNGILAQLTFAGITETFSDPKKMKKEIDEEQRDIGKDEQMPEEWRGWYKQFLGSLEKMPEGAKMPANMEGGPFQPAKIEEVPVSKSMPMPKTQFEVTFPSSILWGILGCVQSFIISIVNERVGGTFLRLRVSPLSWSQVLAGKALACFLSCAMVCVVLLLLGNLIFGVRLNRPLHLLLAISCTSLCFVGILMLLCTLGKTVEGVSGASWGILMPLAMIGGGTIPLMFMPEWLERVSSFSPVKWAILSMEGAIWRGYSFVELLPSCGILLAVGGVCFFLGVRKLSWGEG
jgi:ABC-2 type transport system permease protein